MKSKKTLRWSILILIVSTAFAGCSGKDSNTSTKTNVATIRIGTGNGYTPFCYIDDDGELQGYDVECLEAIDELLPEYEFIFETYDFKSILISLDAGKIDIAAHQFEKNPEREANYLFSNESYTTFTRYITVLKTTEGIETLDDIAASGKKNLGFAGDNAIWAYYMYNEQHPDGPQIELDIVENTYEEQIAGLKTGKWISLSTTDAELKKLNNEYGDILKHVGEPILDSTSYFVFKKGNIDLKNAVDNALKQLKKTGKISELSIKILGEDYTK